VWSKVSRAFLYMGILYGNIGKESVATKACISIKILPPKSFFTPTNTVNLRVAISIWAQTGHPMIACTWQLWDVKGKPRWI